jgi:hypothetical protein
MQIDNSTIINNTDQLTRFQFDIFDKELENKMVQGPFGPVVEIKMNSWRSVS